MWKPHETSTQHLQRSKQKVAFFGQTQAARPGHGHPQAACWDLEDFAAPGRPPYSRDGHP